MPAPRSPVPASMATPPSPHIQLLPHILKYFPTYSSGRRLLSQSPEAKNHFFGIRFHFALTVCELQPLKLSEVWRFRVFGNGLLHASCISGTFCRFHSRSWFFLYRIGPFQKSTKSVTAIFRNMHRTNLAPRGKLFSGRKKSDWR